MQFTGLPIPPMSIAAPVSLSQKGKMTLTTGTFGCQNVTFGAWSPFVALMQWESHYPSAMNDTSIVVKHSSMVHLGPGHRDVEDAKREFQMLRTLHEDGSRFVAVPLAVCGLKNPLDCSLQWYVLETGGRNITLESAIKNHPGLVSGANIVRAACDLMQVITLTPEPLLLHSCSVLH